MFHQHLSWSLLLTAYPSISVLPFSFSADQLPLFLGSPWQKSQLPQLWGLHEMMPNALEGAECPLAPNPSSWRMTLNGPGRAPPTCGWRCGGHSCWRPTWPPEAPNCSLAAGGKQQCLETEPAGQATQKLFSADISPFECLITIPIQE